MSQPSLNTQLDTEYEEGDSQELRCRRLLAAIMVQAVEDWKAMSARSRSGRRAAHSTKFDEAQLRKWFASELVGVRSFVWLCRVLDLEPDAVRRKLYSQYPYMEVMK
jgi:hypothetical protein